MPYVGTAIYISGGRNFISSATIGKTGTNNSNVNTFSNCLYGVYMEGVLDFAKVDYNTFSMVNSSFTLKPKGVVAKTTNITQAYIRNNIFTNGNNGIQYIDMAANTKVYISNNLTTNTTTGIEVSNAVLTTPAILQITTNTINYPATYTATTTTGILVQNVNGMLGKLNPYAYIYNNGITFNVPNFSNKAYGINAITSPYTRIETNVITNTGGNPTSTNASFLIGISENQSANSYVYNNTMTKMGYGLNFCNTMPSTQVKCNTMTTCFYGVELTGATISNQGTATQPWGNKWFTPISYRIHGSLGPGGSMNWYYQTIANELNLPTGSCYVNPGALTTTLSTYPNPCMQGFMAGTTTTSSRTEILGTIVNTIDPTTVSVVGDETQYAEANFAYNKLKVEPALLDMNSPDDYIYQEFYDAAKLSTIGKLDEVNTLTVKDSVADANIANQAIQDENLIEFNKKTVNEIYLKTWAEGIMEFTPADSLTLLNIANQNTFTGGNGVVGARVMLDLQLDDNSIASNARISHPNNDVITENNSIRVYPNPAKDYLTIEFFTTNDNKQLVLEIYNAMGVIINSKIINGNNNLTNISLKNIPSGCYNYKIKNNNEVIKNGKLVILK